MLMAAALSALAFAPAPVTIDERAGTYRGVGLLDTRRTVERRFGRAQVTKDGPWEPLDIDFYDAALPTSSGYTTGAHAVWRFKSVAIVSYGGKAFTMAVTAPGAITRRRVGVGSTLAQVRAQYSGLRCDIANEGTEYPMYPYCAGRVARGRYAWFGGDPVRSVTLSRKTMP